MKAGFARTTNRRGLTLAPIACLVVSALLSTGCVATKSDVRLIRTDIDRLQSVQDSLYRESLRQASTLSDSVRLTSELLRTTRGQLSNQIRELQNMLITLQELLGQTSQGIARLREQAERSAAPPVAPPADNTNADELYRAGAQKLQEKSAAAARVAFEQFLSQFPQHEHAADAQLGLAESYVLDEDYEEAVTQFVRVSEAYPTSLRAPDALYRAGEVSELRKRTEDARKYYNLVKQRYASSPAARLAQQKLDRLRR